MKSYKNRTPLVAIYPRLSDEDRFKKEGDESESIINQKNMLIKYASDQGWNIYDIYCDEDYSGADRDRPEFNRLLKDAEERKFDIVLCKSQSRFTREIKIVEDIIHEKFLLWGIRFVSIVDHADTEDPYNKKQRQVNGLVNEWFLEDTSINIRKVFDHKKREGIHIGSFAVYGYKKDPERKGHLIIDEEAAQVVRLVFQLFVDGMGKTAIARYLNEKGIPNPSEYKRQQGLRFKINGGSCGHLWKYFSISNMLTNEMYIGNMVQSRQKNLSYKCRKKVMIPKEDWIIVPNTHEPIIDIDLWNRAQKLIQLKSKAFDTTGKIGIFSKKVKCLNCGYTMRAAKYHDERYLRCSSRFYDKKSCSGSMISEKRLSNYILNEIRKLAKEFLDKDELERKLELENKTKTKLDENKKLLELYQKQIDKCKTSIKQVYLDKLNGVIQSIDLDEIISDFEKEQMKYEKLATDVLVNIEKIENQKEESTSKQQLIEQYSNVQELTRDMVVTLIDYIEIGSRKKGTKIRPIVIHWNF